GCNFPNCPRATIVEASERDLRVVAVADAISGFSDRDVVEVREVDVAVMTSDEVVHRLGAAQMTAATRGGRRWEGLRCVPTVHERRRPVGTWRAPARCGARPA